MAKVAFIGLGVMGFPMARHLAKKGGHELTVYNRTADEGAEVGRRAWRAAAPIRRARRLRARTFVFSCVGNDDDLRSVALDEDGAIAGMRKGAIYIDNTTASAAVARELAEEAEKRGVGFLDAPVSGGQAGAENGALTVMVGGDQATFDKAKPVIDAYAKMVGLMGPVGAGQLTKMVNQICIAGLVQGLSEGIHFAKKAGLDVEKVIGVISKGAAQSWQMENRWKTMNEGHFTYGFAVNWMRKDLSISIAEARAQWRASSRRGAGRPVLFGGPVDGRPALGYVQPDREAGAEMVRAAALAADPASAETVLAELKSLGSEEEPRRPGALWHQHGAASASRLPASRPLARRNQARSRACGGALGERHPRGAHPCRIHRRAGEGDAGADGRLGGGVQFMGPLRPGLHEALRANALCRGEDCRNGRKTSASSSAAPASRWPPATRSTQRARRTSVFLPFLALVESTANDPRNFVRKAVNWALRQIGKRSRGTARTGPCARRRTCRLKRQDCAMDREGRGKRAYRSEADCADRSAPIKKLCWRRS